MSPPYNNFSPISIFSSIANARKEVICDDRFNANPPTEKIGVCNCTFRNRFLDRWLCIPCFHWEGSLTTVLRSRNHYEITGDFIHGECSKCWVDITNEDEHRFFCNWCHGEILDQEDSEDKSEGSDQESEESLDNDIIDGINNDEPGCREPLVWTHKDGTIRLKWAHKTVQGEVVGRKFVEEWDKLRREEQGDG